MIAETTVRKGFLTDDQYEALMVALPDEML